MSWNRTYRPQTISQLHLSRVKNELQQLLLQPTFPQVFLFTGPKGTGKTSASRILAATVNDPRNAAAIKARIGIRPQENTVIPKLSEPDTNNELVMRILQGHSVAVQELDAASNRGIDDVRALKERVYMPPQEGVISVFILDEAHMLTTEASNALLKLLEEPPAHVLFILATTEAHKILPTIVSRCRTVEFTKATIVELCTALESVLTQERILFEPEVLEYVAQQADGSFRDALKLMERLSGANKKVTMQLAHDLSGGNLEAYLSNIVTAIINNSAKDVSGVFQNLRSYGHADDVVHNQLLKLLHAKLLISLQVEPGEAQWPTPVIQFLLQAFSDPSLKFSATIPYLALELKSLEIISRSQKKKETTYHREATTTMQDSSKAKIKPKRNSNLSRSTSITTTGDGKKLCERWEEFVQSVSQINSTLAAFLRSAQPVAGNSGTATIRVFYEFHRDQLLTPKSQSILQSCVQQLCGGSLDFIFELTQNEQTVNSQGSTEQLATVAASVLM